MKKSLFLPILILFFIAALLFFPEAATSSAKDAIKLLLEAVIPALLPFFICSELLMTSGALPFIALCTGPVLRPLFRLPGTTALPVIIGFSSGAPTAAAITSDLYEKQLCTKKEAERVLAFTNNPSPLYILSVIGVGIFSSPELGIYLLKVIYGTALVWGIFLSIFAGRKEKQTNILSSSLRDSYNDIASAKRPPFANLLSRAIKKSAMNMTIISGFIIFFAVLTGLLSASGVFNLFTPIIGSFLELIGIEGSLSTAIAGGFFEMTIGCAALSSSNAPIFDKLVIAAALLIWNGVSVHSQVQAMTYRTDLSLRLFRIGKIIQTAAVITICLIFPPNFSTMGTGDTAYILPKTSTLMLVSFGILTLTAFIGRIITRKQRESYF